MIFFFFQPLKLFMLKFLTIRHITQHLKTLSHCTVIHVPYRSGLPLRLTLALAWAVSLTTLLPILLLAMSSCSTFVAFFFSCITITCRCTNIEAPKLIARTRPRLQTWTLLRPRLTISLLTAARGSWFVDCSTRASVNVCMLVVLFILNRLCKMKTDKEKQQTIRKLRK